jgi:hypothetical protein
MKELDLVAAALSSDSFLLGCAGHVIYCAVRFRSVSKDRKITI